MKKDGIGKKAYVGVSGGVDSAVSLARMIERGFDVTGCFIRGWHPPYLECTWKEDRREAMRVCAALDVPFVEFDASKTYEEAVVREMVAGYERGVTPNPDILCNERVKFGVFYDFAMAAGADVVATGHYARIARGHDGAAELHTAADPAKDQTYFLRAVPNDRFAHIEFPIGDLRKDEVRRIASRIKLPNAHRPDSQGVCFLGHVDLADFMARHVSMHEGEVVTVTGELIGTHRGIAAYTVGQRHGLSLHTNTTSAEPLYVLSKDASTNQIVVGPKHMLDNATAELDMARCNWIGAAPSIGDRVLVRHRHRGEMSSAEIIALEGDTATIRFQIPTEAIDLGQSVSLYVGTRCLGGGDVSATRRS